MPQALPIGGCQIDLKEKKIRSNHLLSLCKCSVQKGCFKGKKHLTVHFGAQNG